MDNEGAANPELVSMLKMLAEDGDFESQKMLAYMYYEGEGFNENINESLFWSNVCISNIECNKEEMLTLNIRIGYILRKQKNYDGALEKFNSILNSDDVDTKTKEEINISIADIYYDVKDDFKAEEIYNNIINKQDITNEKKIYIYKRLSHIYMNKRDFKKAIDILEEGIKLTNPPDENILNSFGFANEMYGNFTKAFEYYSLASIKGSIYGNLNLGYLYNSGLGVEKNLIKALMYYEKEKDSLEEWKISREKFDK